MIRLFTLAVAVVFLLSNSGVQAVVETEKEDDTDEAALATEECVRVAPGDHVLFSYQARFENGTVGPTLSDYHQPFYARIPKDGEDTILGMTDKMKGLCENSTHTFAWDNVANSDLRPIIPETSPIYELEESFDVRVHIQKVTTSDNYRIFEALRSGNISLVLDLVEQHVGINAMDEYGQTPLMIAVSKQYLPVIASLLNTRRPKVEVNQAKATGFTALFYAVEKASPTIMQALLRRGADPNLAVAQDGSKGNTPLHFACMLEKVKHAELLLDYGANPYLKNEHGLVPFRMIPRDVVASARLKYKQMFEEARKKFSSQMENGDSSGEL